ncbi:aminotransferase class I/II-fold pyridoxal phosphate-dependent enzyme [Streptomyces iconiensis]|uniref:alanine transaminase n=1 Tax=Streptomyces iconiensis TaxID=1384038 RepID=A0ABT7A486_9ACTN|nr:aminotransferase class I/II-fold pyridoxal phosphate-dependent enzyme [Streptomyces iconiensis]MDJ1135656.1 aminotransferase class I/II-fold pyridoxal phosphate-dependent enzyme [Streptomyces iconiensis]
MTAPHRTTARDPRPSVTARRLAPGLRGPLMKLAARLRAEGRELIDLNLGDPAAHGLDPPDHVVGAVRERLGEAGGYTPETGTGEARTAVAEHFRDRRGISWATPRDVCLGNGVSELATLTTQALLDPGDQVLVPSPGYPLWRACVGLTGAVPVPYPCREDEAWTPDPGELAARVGPRTRAIVVINPGNPTGAVWPPRTLEEIAAVARAHDLVLFADEVYDEVRYGTEPFVPLATFAPDLLCLSFGGLSKFCRLPGYRVGWVLLSRPPGMGEAYRDTLAELCSLRLCPNATGQLAVPPALSATTRAGVRRVTAPDGALTLRRNTAYQALTQLPGVSCALPQGAFYAYPRLPLPARLRTEEFAEALLRRESVLVAPGSVFAPSDDHPGGPPHIRLTTLAEPSELAEGIRRMDRLLTEFRRTPDPA